MGQLVYSPFGDDNQISFPLRWTDIVLLNVKKSTIIFFIIVDNILSNFFVFGLGHDFWVYNDKVD